MSEMQDIDLIHEAEESAEEKIRAAEERARVIRRQTEIDVKKIMNDAEIVGNASAERLLKENESKRASRERRYQKRIDGKIAEIQGASRNRILAATHAVVEMILGAE